MKAKEKETIKIHNVIKEQIVVSIFPRAVAVS